jgi:hypothetical protein
VAEADNQEPAVQSSHRASDLLISPIQFNPEKNAIAGCVRQITVVALKIMVIFRAAFAIGACAIDR